MPICFVAALVCGLNVERPRLARSLRAEPRIWTLLGRLVVRMEPEKPGRVDDAARLERRDRGSEALQGALLQDWYAPDLTEDPRSGIGSWSIEDIVRYLKTGGNSYDIASGPMAEAVANSTSKMTDDDLLAIATYLKDRAPRSGRAVTALAADVPLTSSRASRSPISIGARVKVSGANCMTSCRNGTR